MTRQGRRRAQLRVLPLVVLVVLVAGSIGAFAVSRQVGDDQEQRLLNERAGEVGALLANAIDSIESSLRVLGPIGASSDPAAMGLFERSAAPLVERNTKAVGVAAEDGTGRFKVVAAVGDGPPVGAVLDSGRTAVVSRALAEGELVSDLISAEAGTRLALARPVAGARAVAYQESAVNPARPVPSTPQSPFRELRVALYASPRVDPDRLVIKTEARVPLSGRVERVPFSVGADRWLLAVGARGPLVGSVARNVPWLLLGVGLVSAMLVTAIIETLARRRAYALALVAERTRELEQALGELGETRAFLERLLTAGPVLVRRVTVPDRVISYVSPNVERLFGVTEAEALAPGFLGSLVHPEDGAAFGAALDRVAEGLSAREEIEYRLRRGEGPTRWVSATLVPETDDGGQIVAVLGYVIDVDDRRRAERAQRDAQEVAEAANQAKSEFLSRMSHELRTPLNAVLGFGQLLEIDELTDAQRDAVDHILKGGRHLLDLINEVLDISRIEAGELSLSPEPVLAAGLIQETVDLIRPLADQRGIQLVVNGSGCDCYVFADRQRAKQVLLNLLSNAVKYNRPRGTVAVSCEQPDPTRVRISVTDTGVGIPAERMGLLFIPFERLGAEQTGEEGTGIGLALSKRLADAMGGTLGAASTLTQGSTFTVELPRVEGPVERYERLNGDPQPTGQPAAPDRTVVLHIEDNLSNLTLVERVLAQRAGVEVVAAMHGSLGLELAREHHPVLVLLDLHLPDLGGEHVLQRLRDDPATASIPVVIVSADATNNQVQRLLSAGAAAYLTKPIDVSELLRLLDEALARR